MKIMGEVFWAIQTILAGIMRCCDAPKKEFQLQGSFRMVLFFGYQFDLGNSGNGFLAGTFFN